MALLRSTCLALGILLTSLALRDSVVVHAQQATGKAIVANKNKNGIAMTQVDAPFVSKEIFEGIPSATDTFAATANKRLGGRKVLQGSILRKNMMEEETVNRKIPKISGAANSVGKCDPERKGEVNIVHCKSRNRSLLPLKKAIRVNGFVAFTADYGVPTHHPPKNN